MNHRKKVLTLSLLSLLTLAASYLFLNPLQFGICRSEYSYQTNYRKISEDDIARYSEDLIRLDESGLYTFDIATGCADSIDESVGQPLAFFSVITFFFSIVFLFVRESVFGSWLRFAKYYLPVAAVLIIMAGGGTGGSWAGLDFDRELATLWLAGIFFVVSLGIIIWKSISLRRRG